jgi:hypothetical protein
MDGHESAPRVVRFGAFELGRRARELLDPRFARAVARVGLPADRFVALGRVGRAEEEAE